MTVWDKGLGPPYINTSWLDESERERELFLNKLIYNPRGLPVLASRRPVGQGRFYYLWTSRTLAGRPAGRVRTSPAASELEYLHIEVSKAGKPVAVLSSRKP